MTDGNSMRLIGDVILTIGVILLVVTNFYAFAKADRLIRTYGKGGARTFNLGILIGAIIICSVVFIVIGLLFGIYAEISAQTTYPVFPTLNL